MLERLEAGVDNFSKRKTFVIDKAASGLVQIADNQLVMTVVQ